MNSGIYAPIVGREVPDGKGQTASYQDCTPWGGGLIRYRPSLRGGVILNAQGHVLDLQTSEVYLDARYTLDMGTPKECP